MLKVNILDGDFLVEAGAAPPMPPPNVVARIEEIWNQEMIKHEGKLFNSPLFSVDQITNNKVSGWFSEYKMFIAQRIDPTLSRHIMFKPLAVTGLLLSSDGIIIGKRSENVEQDADCWELVPSGGVDGPIDSLNGIVDLNVAVLNELEEEIGINANLVSLPLKPLLVVEDLENHVVDIGVIIQTKLTAKKIISIFNDIENREYVALDVLPFDQLYDSENYRFLSPVSQAIMSNSGVISSLN